MDKSGFGNKVKGFFASGEPLSILIILTFLVLAISSIFISPQLYKAILREGDISLKGIYAPYDFTYQWDVDDEATKKVKDAAVAKVPFYLKRETAPEKASKDSLESFFSALSEPAAPEETTDARIQAIKTKTGVDIGDKNVKVLLENSDHNKLKEAALTVMKNVFDLGYIDDPDLEAIKSSKAEKIVILNEKTGAGAERKPAELLSRQELKSVLEDFATKEVPSDRKARPALIALLSFTLEPSMKVDEKRLVSEREAAAAKIEPIYNAWTVKKNELIIEKGGRINARHIAQISQLRSLTRPGRSASFFFGVLLLFLLLGMIGVIDLSFPRKTNLLASPKNIAVVFLNMLLMIIVSDIVMRSPQPIYFLPMSAMAMMITLLVGVNTAFLSAILMSILISVLVGGKIEVMLVLLVGSVVGISVVREARRRSVILWAGFLVGVAEFMAIVCVGLMNGMELDFYVEDGLWGLASGVLSSFIVMGLLPLFEFFFKVPTNISLLELSDLNHPLLKSLALEAPGTYHHSIMVGNLAESACDAIGANSLLARVGAYYHDIGKISKPEYFSENEMGSGSRHENLTPSMSALIISKHVKEGAEIAHKYKLNSAIVDLITQHHGDSMISYFYQKAIEKSEDGTVLNEEDFRYPGPKPQTKEGAIILLSDSVEASSRALEDPTPSSIGNLVRKIINNKFIDGQLDECDLTLRDMHKIADSFVRVLMAVFHTRLSYPEESKKAPDILNGNKNKLRKQKPQKNG
jgi:hypothetical protein